jgi:hypothetical protein
MVRPNGRKTPDRGGVVRLLHLFRRKPRFCQICGRKYQRLPHERGFSAKTGESWTTYEWRCPRAKPTSSSRYGDNDCWPDPPRARD